MSTIQKIQKVIFGVIYVRVSDPTQVSGTSLESQRAACLAYAESKNIKVVKVFIERGESATVASRTEFIKALDFCSKNKGKIGAFIVWKVDRYARNQIDHFGVKAKLIQYGTTLHSTTEPIEDTPIGKMMEGMLAAYAQFENDIRRQRCEGGMQSKIADGIFPWCPPLGYTHSKKRTDKRKTKPDEPDPERFHLIQKGLKAYAEGGYTITTLTALWNQWRLKTRTGKPMFKQLVEKLLRNKYYAGILINPWTGEEHQGLHQPMITPEEYHQIQHIKSGLSNNTTVGRQNPHPDFPLRNSVVHCVCKEKFTGSWQTGRYKRYAYYRCNNRRCPNYSQNIRKDILETQFYSFLKNVTPQKEFLKLFQAIVMDVWTSKRGSLQDAGKKYDTELKQFEAQKEKLMEMRVSGEISKEEFTLTKDALENKIAGTRIAFNESKIDEFDLEAALSYATQFVSDPARQWQDMDVKRQQRFQVMVLPQGITYDRSTHSFGTAVLSPIFTLSEAYKTSPSDFVAGDEGLSNRNYGSFWLLAVSICEGMVRHSKSYS